ncbi:unnamed protein product, partial [Brassica oleracea var. botrytis]
MLICTLGSYSVASKNSRSVRKAQLKHVCTSDAKA